MPLQLNQLIDSRYIVIKALAVGGMAEIYEANDTFYHRPVSIKILKETSLDSESIELFKNEIRFASSFNNSHIYKIYNIGQHNKRPFMVYEPIKGKTVKEALDERGHFTTAETINFMLQIFDALKQIHAREITHNDLKPDNIMLLHDGTLKLVDFGIATHVYDAAFEHLKASAQYVAPEVVQNKKYTVQSDIYSMGIILFEFLTGKTPFLKSNSMDEIKAHLYDNIPSISIYGEISHFAEFDEIIAKATDRKLSLRYKSINEFENDILKIKNGESLKKNKFFNLFRKLI